MKVDDVHSHTLPSICVHRRREEEKGGKEVKEVKEVKGGRKEGREVRKLN